MVLKMINISLQEVNEKNFVALNQVDRPHMINVDFQERQVTLSLPPSADAHELETSRILMVPLRT